MLLRTALCCALLLALSGCDRKPAQPAPAEPSASGSTTAAAPQASAPATAPVANCDGVPSKTSLQAALQSAMLQIYGPDEVAGKYVVTAITPSDCDHLTVAYHKVTAGATHETAPLNHADGAWTITLFNKPYPVQGS